MFVVRLLSAINVRARALLFYRQRISTDRPARRLFKKLCVAAVKLAHEWPGVYILQPWPRYTMRVRNMEHYQHVSTKLARNAADARHHR